MADDNKDFMQWWRDARFGMFIHWGLYAIPAGVWKGRLIPGIGEWIMFRAQIPVEEYEGLTKQFYPIKFDAAEWVKVAKDAGMKYLTLTSKHHDGFALFKSPCSSYNIVDATPYGKDPIADLAVECRKAGIKLCFYYSQSQDWHEPNGLGNTWDFKPDEEKDFQKYLDGKVKPQLKELLTQYGPVGMIWFDTPKSITTEQSLELKKYVKSIQPDCIVSGRIGNELGDYGSLGDNEHPAGPAKGDWETPCTLNDTWGYKSYDDNWKDVDELLELLVNCASKGVNYLLNVGPTQEGVIPEESVERLKAVGDWLQINGEAVYGTQAGPYPYDIEGVRMTRKGHTLYLMFKQWPNENFSLLGLKNTVLGARLLSDGRADIGVEQTMTEGCELLTLSPPVINSDELFPVFALDLDGAAQVDERIWQQLDGSIALPAHVAVMRNSDGGKARIGRNGATEFWNDPSVSVEWEYQLREPGTFTVVLEMIMNRHRTNRYGTYRVEFEASGTTVSGEAGLKNISTDTTGDPWHTATAEIGELKIGTAGEVKASCTIKNAVDGVEDGFPLATVKLIPKR